MVSVVYVPISSDCCIKNCIKNDSKALSILPMSKLCLDRERSIYSWYFVAPYPILNKSTSCLFMKS